MAKEEENILSSEDIDARVKSLKFREFEVDGTTFVEVTKAGSCAPYVRDCIDALDVISALQHLKSLRPERQISFGPTFSTPKLSGAGTDSALLIIK